LRHGRGAPALGFAHLADLILGQEQEIEAELAERPGDQGEPARELGDRVPLAVPGHGRAAEVQLRGERFHDLHPARTERGEVAGGAT
jgi:hypothetical protein